MGIDTKSVKIFEADAFAQLTRGARLFRRSRTNDDSASSPEKQPRNTATPNRDLTPAKTKYASSSDCDVTAVINKTDELIISSSQEIPKELNKTANFIDRRIVTDSATGDSIVEQGSSSGVSAEALGSGTADGGNEKRGCLTCDERFEDVAAQRRHYQLDWHRCNLHRALRSRSPVTEEQFAELVDADDMSSISGSESDWEESESEAEGAAGAESSDGAEPGAGPGPDRHVHVFFENAQQQVFSLHRCLLQAKKESPTEEQLVASCRALATNTRWAIILAGGGHFAAAIFHAGNVQVHKTFHTYTVRRGQGTAQGLRDARGSAPKSAGAALRRRNELTLAQDVGAVLASWRTELSRCSLLFVRAGSGQRAALGSALASRDPRRRSLPFPTRRATLAECQRAYDLLAAAIKHGSAAALRASLRRPDPAPASADSKPAPVRGLCRDASREPRPRPTPGQPGSSPDDDEDATTTSGEELSMQTELVDLGELREFESTKRRPRRPRRGRRPGKPAPASAQPAPDAAPDAHGKHATAAAVQADEEAAEEAGARAEAETAARTEKRAAARRQRRERLQEKRREDQRLRDEEDQRQRYLLLSDREKRALAAERRLAIAVRCVKCGADMTGKVPFCYLDLRFCCVGCLQAHRRAAL